MRNGSKSELGCGAVSLPVPIKVAVANGQDLSTVDREAEKVHRQFCCVAECLLWFNPGDFTIAGWSMTSRHKSSPDQQTFILLIPLETCVPVYLSLLLQTHSRILILHYSCQLHTPNTSSAHSLTDRAGQSGPSNLSK